MSMTQTSIAMPDGDARSFVFTPAAGTGPWPAVILFMDAPAIRQALFEMGQRLADGGYYVLLPDMFWRAGRYAPINMAPINMKEAMRDDESRRAAFGVNDKTDWDSCWHKRKTSRESFNTMGNLVRSSKNIGNACRFKSRRS